MNVQETRPLKINCLATTTVLAIQPGVNNSQVLTMSALRVTFTWNRAVHRRARGKLFFVCGRWRRAHESFRAVELLSSIRHAQVASDRPGRRIAASLMPETAL